MESLVPEDRLNKEAGDALYNAQQALETQEGLLFNAEQVKFMGPVQRRYKIEWAIQGVKEAFKQIRDAVSKYWEVGTDEKTGTYFSIKKALEALVGTSKLVIETKSEMDEIDIGKLNTLSSKLDSIWRQRPQPKDIDGIVQVANDPTKTFDSAQIEIILDLCRMAQVDMSADEINQMVAVCRLAESMKPRIPEHLPTIQVLSTFLTGLKNIFKVLWKAEEVQDAKIVFGPGEVHHLFGFSKSLFARETRKKYFNVLAGMGVTAEQIKEQGVETFDWVPEDPKRAGPALAGEPAGKRARTARADPAPQAAPAAQAAPAPQAGPAPAPQAGPGPVPRAPPSDDFIWNFNNVRGEATPSPLKGGKGKDRAVDQGPAAGRGRR